MHKEKSVRSLDFDSGCLDARSAVLHDEHIDLEILRQKNLELLGDVFLGGHAGVLVRSRPEDLFFS